jgi:hypothetical protein
MKRKVTLYHLHSDIIDYFIINKDKIFNADQVDWFVTPVEYSITFIYESKGEWDDNGEMPLPFIPPVEDVNA